MTYPFPQSTPFPAMSRQRFDKLGRSTWFADEEIYVRIQEEVCNTRYILWVNLDRQWSSLTPAKQRAAKEQCRLASKDAALRTATYRRLQRKKKELHKCKHGVAIVVWLEDTAQLRIDAEYFTPLAVRGCNTLTIYFAVEGEWREFIELLKSDYDYWGIVCC